MSHASADIYSLLVPLATNRLLLPQANIAEVTGYKEPQEIAATPTWVLGNIMFDGARIPLVSFEGANGGDVPSVGVRTRITLLRTLTDVLDVPYIGIITQGFPQLVRVNTMVLKHHDSQEWSATGPVLCQVEMVSQTPLIPNVERLEQMIADALAATH